jgi:hypothetical protein
VPFPGIATLLPTLGTVAFLWANRTAVTAGRVLSWSPIVFVGKISYSFYLVHWPVMAYADYWFRDQMSWIVRLGLMIGALLLAVLSYYAVETPVRKGMVFSVRRPLFASALGFTLVLVAIGFFVQRSEGLRSRFDAQTLVYIPEERANVEIASQLSLRDVESGRLFEFGDLASDIKCLAWGDSHGMALMPALDDLCVENSIHGVSAMYSATPPLLGFVNKNGIGQGVNTVRFNNAIIKEAIAQKVQFVVMAAFWSRYASDPQFGKCLNDTVDQLKDAGITVVLIRDVPVHTSDIPRSLIRAHVLGWDVHSVGLPIERHRDVNRFADGWLASQSGPGVHVLDPTSLMVDDKSLCRGEWNGVAMYRDHGHVSPAGARRLKPMLEFVFQSFRPRESHSTTSKEIKVGDRPQDQSR